MKSAVRITLFILFVAVFGSHAFAQFAQRGSIGGTVTDTSGAIVPNASVTLLDLEHNQTTTQTTNSSGRYEFSQLTAGTYKVTIEAPGFNKVVSDPLQVTTQGEVRYDSRLQVGAVTQQVEVSTATPLLQSQTVDLDVNITQQQVDTLPINGRNWTSLTELTPGVSTYPRNNINLGGTYEVGASYTNGGADYAAGGNVEGSRDNGYYVNGVNANDNYVSGSSFQPSAEAIGEVKIGVADFSAQYGRDFTNVNLTTKAGSNAFHGEIYEFFENNALNALVPINKAQGELTASPFRFNQFGGGIGGPIYIPKLLNLKNKAFFFVNYEQNPRSLLNVNNLAIVPSVAQRAGDFAENCTGPVNGGTFNASGMCLDSKGNPLTAGQLYNPYTGAPLPYNNLVTAGLYNASTAPAQVTAITNLFPQPNLTPTVANGGANYQFTSRQAVNPYHLDSRFDVKLSSRDSVFVAWSKYGAVPNNSGGLVSGLSQGNADVPDSSYVVSADEAHTFSARVTNEFLFAIGSGTLATLSPSEIAYLNSAANPFNSIFQNTGTGANAGIMAINIYNYGPQYTQPTFGFQEYFRDVNSSLQFNDNLSWIRGNHNMSLGFNYLRKGEKDFDNVRYLAFGCAPAPTQAYCGAGPQIFTGSGGAGGDAFADTLLGIPSVIHQRFQYTAGGDFAPVPNLVIPYYGAYFSDQWKLTPHLTMTYGVRYDLPLTPYATNNLCCAVYEASTNSLAIPGIAPGLSKNYAPAPKHDFAPRLSFAWQPTANRVIRAGYGLYWNSGASQISNVLGSAFYGGIPGGFFGQETDFTTPVPDSITQAFGPSPSITPGTFPNPTGTGQGNYGPGAYQAVQYADKNSYRTPYMHRYMLDIQQELNRNTAVTLTYLGAQGRNGWYYADENVPAYRTGWPLDEVAYNNARPNNSGYFGDIYVQRAGLNSNYNAGIIQFQHRMGHGVQILSHYTFSKTLGTRGIVGQGTQDTGYNYPQNVLRSYGEETSSHRHRFLFEALYEPKYSQRLPVYLRPALGDWHLSIVTTLESGDALTALNGEGNVSQDNAPYSGLDDLNVLRNPNFGHSQRTYAEYFDTSAFVSASCTATTTPTNPSCVKNPIYAQGTAGPGSIRGPGQNNSDLSIGKIFPFHGGFHAEFRADAYNAWNHTQWNAVSTQLNGSTGPFGQVTGSREGRILNLAAKVVF